MSAPDACAWRVSSRQSFAEVALVRPEHPQEFDQWRWARIEELVGLIVPFKRAVYEQVVRDFSALVRPHDGP